MKKNILIIITVIFLTTTLGIFMVSNLVLAQESKCPPSEKQIRMQVYIPGVTESVKGADPPCYYIKSDLPAYIKQLYSFTIGAIAIIAVIMIMIGGLKWIFAAGNPTRIGAARQQITAAVAGLILALCSYVLLNAINPSLTKLTMKMPEEIGKIEQAEDNWCEKLPNKIKGNNDLFVTETKDGSSGSVAKDQTQCGKTYYYGYKINNKFISMGECIGQSGCSSEAICASVKGAMYCIDPKVFCENYNKSHCDEVDKVLQEVKPAYGCAFNKRVSFWGDWALEDGCAYNDIIFCNKPNSIQVSCLDSDAENICWKRGKDEKIVSPKLGGDETKYCVSPGENVRPVVGPSFVCCKDYSGYYAETIRGCRLNTECSDYMNKNECEKDICGFSKTGCKWQGGTCVVK